ncbi:MAG: hypothetical protein ACJA0V_002728 [Planctomycetota bacterium]|jgi:hypothetical protein
MGEPTTSPRSGTARAVAAITMLALVLGSCQINSGSLQAPAQVSAGQVFSIVIEGTVFGGNNAAVAALQLPSGFTVLDSGAVIFGQEVGMHPINNHLPEVVAVLASEPQHTVTVFSGHSSVGAGGLVPVRLRVFLQAPPVTGNYTLKVAFGDVVTNYQQQLPAAVTDFASITAAPYAAQVQVIAAAPSTPFEFDNEGLWRAQNNITRGRRPTLYDADGDGIDELLMLRDSTLEIWSRIAGQWVQVPSSLSQSTITDFVIADLDLDGNADIVDGSGQLHVGQPGISWSPGPVVPHGLVNARVAAGDIDNDGDLDLAFADGTSYRVFRNDGSNNFTDVSVGLPPVVNAPTVGELLLVDIDGDAQAELVSMRTSGATGTLTVFQLSPTGWQGVGQISPTGRTILATDLDGDGIIDLSTGGPIAYRLVNQSLLPIPNPLPSFFRAAAFDYDGDDKPDVVGWNSALVMGEHRHQLQLWHNNGGGSFSGPMQVLEDPVSNLALWGGLEIATGHINDDTSPDLLTLQGWFGAQAIANILPSTRRFGEGCAAAGMSAPDLDVLGTVAPGQPIVMQVSGATPSGIALFWIGGSRRDWLGQPLLPLSLASVGAPGCNLLTEPGLIAFRAADSAGVGSLALTLPNVPAIARLVLFGQAATVSPTANALGLLFSNGVAVRIQ